MKLIANMNDGKAIEVRGVTTENFNSLVRVLRRQPAPQFCRVFGEFDALLATSGIVSITLEEA